VLRDDSPDWRVLLALLCTASGIEITAWSHQQAFAPLFLAQELGMRATEIPFWTGVLAALPLAVAVPLAPFWGVFADRYSRKLIIVRSLAFESVAYLLAALSHSLLAFIAVRLLLGLAFGNNAIAVALLSLVVPERRLATAVGLFTTMFPIGLSAGPLVGSGLIALLGLRGMYAADAALTTSAAALLLLGLREPARAPCSAAPGVRAQLGTVFGIVGRMPPIRWNFVLWFLISGGAAALDPYLPVLIGQLSQGPALATTIGLVLALYGLASGLCAPLTPRLVDRFGEPRTLALACLLLAAVAFALPGAGSVALVAALLLLRAGPQAATNTALFTHLARYSPREHRGAVLALSPLPRNAALLVAPLAGSTLASLGLGAVFGLAGTLFTAGLGATVLLERATRAPQALAATPVRDA
jgi:DHA1 family multidrug resistance protein-like MFS transporter